MSSHKYVLMSGGVQEKKGGYHNMGRLEPYTDTSKPGNWGPKQSVFEDDRREEYEDPRRKKQVRNACKSCK